MKIRRRTKRRAAATLLAMLLLAALLCPLAGLAAAEAAPVTMVEAEQSEAGGLRTGEASASPEHRASAAQGGAIDLTGLVQAVIAVLAALITGRLLPWIKARTSQAQREGLEAATRTLVYAAQQLYKTGEIQDRLDYVQEGLLQRGFAVDRDAIEAAVRQLNLMDITIVGEAIKMQEGKIDE